MKTSRVSNFMKNHNWNYLDGKDNYWLIHYFLKSLVLLICLFGCFWLIFDIVRLYFDYPTTVFVNLQTMDKLQLPSITLCNSNRFVIFKYLLNFQIMQLLYN